MQWCAVCGYEEPGVNTPGVEGKAQHKSYTDLKVHPEMLQTQGEIEDMRLSHGWSDDESYHPLAAVQAQAAQPVPRDSSQQSDDGVRPMELEPLGPPPPINDTESLSE